MIELIPAIDLIDGKCVRLTQGDYDTKKVYNEDPLEVAKAFEDNGIRRLHVVDLDGAREGRIINYRTLERLATRTSLVTASVFRTSKPIEKKHSPCMTRSTP